jgi:hypothetical protein
MVEAKRFLHVRSRNICLFRFNFLLLCWLHSIIIWLLLLIVGKVHCIAFVVQSRYWQFECWLHAGDARPSWLVRIDDEGSRWLLLIRRWANCHFWCLHSHGISIELGVLHEVVNLVVAADDRAVFVNEKWENVGRFSWLLWNRESAASCLCFARCLYLVFSDWHASNEWNNGQIAVVASDPLVFSPICWYVVERRRNHGNWLHIILSRRWLAIAVKEVAEWAISRRLKRAAWVSSMVPFCRYDWPEAAFLV